MLRRKYAPVCILVIALVALAATATAGDDKPAASEGQQTVGQVVGQIVKSENALMDRLRNFRPLVETYIQNLTGDEQVGAIPKSDEYFLGKMDLSSGLRTDSMLRGGKGIGGKFTGALKGTLPMRMRYVLESFAAMALVDRSAFDASRYEFRFIRREFLGETRCLVFEIRPQGRKSDGFSGRIWAEDKDFTIVRFNGMNGSLPGSLGHEDFHFDSWRVQMGSGLWLPAYIYSEESDLGYGLIKARKAHFKAQTRIWGYDAKQGNKGDEFTAILVDEAAARDRSEVEKQMSPVRSLRQWERTAEDNVLERLEKARLLAPPSDVDKVLETVINNLVVTNQLSIDPEPRARVLLTSPLETLAIGRTIVLSRGMIDVLPDEASLAMMLAHELGHMILGHQLIDTKYSFADRMMIDDTEILESFRFRREPAEETAADAKAIELLRRSPYNDKLAGAGLFLRAMASRAKQLPNLIRPHMGDRLARGGDIVRFAELMSSAPALEAKRLDQIAALPLGGRIYVDPWNGRIEMAKSRPAPLAAAREKMPFEISPFNPYLAYQNTPKEPLAARSASPDGAK